MKKITLSLAGVLAAVAFAPEASAVPAFARQVGMACTACHYQHFPVLNGFGRAFKTGGYTMTGAQEKIEADGLSLPSTLNAALVGYFGYTKTNGPATVQPAAAAYTTNDGSLGIPQQVSLFLGGRGGEHFGYEAEVNLSSGGVAPAGGIGIIRMKIPFVNDIGDIKTGIVPFSTGLGPADSYEVLNTGSVAVHAFNQSDINAVSAQQYINTGKVSASGLALFAANDNFFGNLTKWSASTGVGASGGPSSSYLRGAFLTDKVAGFDSAIGFQSWRGNSNSDATGIPVAVDTKAFAIDGQMMGDVSGMPLLLVASYAKAPASPVVGTANLFNAGNIDRTSFNIGAELGVIPNVATVQVGFRSAKSGADAGLIAGAAATGSSATDNAIMLGATYNIALNMRAELTYSKYSGSSYGAAVAATTGAGYLGDNRVAVDLAFGF